MSDIKFSAEDVVPPPTLSLRASKQKARKLGKRSITSGRGKQFSLAKRLGSAKVSDVADVARAAWTGVKTIMSLINVEEKMFDVSSSNAVVSYAGTVDNLTNIAQGSDYNNRDGNSILVQKLEIRLQALNSTTPAQFQIGQLLRVLLVRDTLFTSGVDPTPAEFLEVTGTGQAALSPMNHVHSGNKTSHRFRVLLDRMFSFDPPFATTISTTGTGVVDALGRQSYCEKHLLHVGAHTMYQGSTAADSSDYVGGLYLLKISNIQTNGPVLSYYSRVFYTDN